MPPQSSSAGTPAAICIRAPNWVGDVVMATPAFRCIRRHFSSSRIALIIRDSVAPVLRGAPWFDHWILCRSRAAAGRPALWSGAEFLRCVSGIRSQRCELGFVLPNSFSSALMLRLAGVPRRVGYIRDGRRFLLTDALPRPSADGRFLPTYMADYYLALCDAVGACPHDAATELPFTPEDVRAAEAILECAGIGLNRPLFLLHPGAAFGPSKLWGEDRFAVLADLLQGEFAAQIACIGSPADGAIARRIAHAARAQVFDLTDRAIDLHLLKCVVARSKLLVTTDSGPRHYGVALGVPTVCLMGPTDPRYSTSGRPWDHVVRVDVECGPCQQKVCKLDHCCMERLTPGMVMDACRSTLRSAEGPAQRHGGSQPAAGR